MQTFLPYESFTASAESLDYKRLGKQRVETKQLLNALDGNSKGWVNHPATVMWRGHRPCLTLYGIEICEEWIRRGYKDSLLPEFETRLKQYLSIETAQKPAWLGDERLHISHRANLIRKDPEFYIPKFGEINPDLPYVWFNPDGTLRNNNDESE